MLDTKNEHDDTYRFLSDCERWYGLEIERISSNNYLNIEETWFKHLSLNTANGAICSYMLKRKVREEWQNENKYKHQVFGFEYDKKEINRANSLSLNHPKTFPLFPLIDKKLTKNDCIRYVQNAEISIPLAYKLGFKNNNCLKTGCVQGGIGYWKKIQAEMPDLFYKMAKVEHDISRIKGKPITMMKDQSIKAKESGNNLVFLIKNPDFPMNKCLDEMKGRKVNPLQECNGFCGINELNIQSKTELELNFSNE